MVPSAASCWSRCATGVVALGDGRVLVCVGAGSGEELPVQPLREATARTTLSQIPTRLLTTREVKHDVRHPTHRPNAEPASPALCFPRL